MLNKAQGLTSEEGGMIQNPTNLYSLIKNLQFILNAYNNGQMDDETYKKELNSISEKIEKNHGIHPDAFIKMEQNFSELDIILGTDPETLTVADILLLYLDLYNIIVDLKKYINLQDDNIRKIKECYLNLKNNREAAEIISEEEQKQMKTDLSVAHSTIMKQLESIK